METGIGIAASLNEVRGAKLKVHPTSIEFSSPKRRKSSFKFLISAKYTSPWNSKPGSRQARKIYAARSTSLMLIAPHIRIGGRRGPPRPHRPNQ
jgi:hypothetical protein